MPQNEAIKKMRGEREKKNMKKRTRRCASKKKKGKKKEEERVEEGAGVDEATEQERGGQ